MIIDIDWKAFEKDCRDIVNEIADKFWDLGLDDGNRSDYGQDLIQKQQKFRKEFEKLNFQFDSQQLNKPKGSEMNEELLQQTDEDLAEEAVKLSRELQMVNDIIHGTFKKLITVEGQVVQSY